jgi:hypothetical protein
MATSSSGGGSVVKVQGVTQLARALRDMDADLGDLRAVNVQVAAVVWRAAVMAAPRRSGDLALSVKPGATRFRAKVGSRKVYAGPIHWGWAGHNIRAQPFAATAASDTEAKWLRLYLDEMQRLCDKVATACPPPTPLTS